MADDPRKTAFDPNAPADERSDAHAILSRASMPAASELISPGLIETIAGELQFAKAAQIIDFPMERRAKAAGMQSMRLDDMQVAMMGDYFERPGSLTPDQMRAMVDRTPVLGAVILTRQRQVARFCQPSEDGGLGFAIRHVDMKHELAPEEEASIASLTKFIQHCGWEFNPRRRKKLGRDSFPTMMQKLTRDTLSMDAAAIETEARRDRSLGIAGLYAIDGSTIRLCPETGFRGDPDIFALQVVNGRIITSYDAEGLIYEPRNPRADVRFGGYGYSETEALIQIVTGFLNAMTLNISGFNKNSIPKGMLHLAGDYSNEDLAAFKRYWQTMTRGAENAWALPIMVSKDQEAKASFEAFGIEFNEMYFSKWMTFLTSIICAVYGIAPDEINFESFTNGSSSLSGNDTVEKLAASKDKGLRPLLTYFEGLITDYVLADFSDKYCFRFMGLDEKDQAREWEGKKLILTVDELRAESGYEPHPDEQMGGAPLNPALIGLYQAAQQPQGQDFGAGGAGDFGQDDEDGPGPGDEGQDDEDEPGPGDEGQGGAGGPGANGAPPPPGGNAGDGMDMPMPRGGNDFGKALPTIYTIGG